jgi:hypothetical protein
VLPDMTPVDAVNVLYGLAFLRFALPRGLANRMLGLLHSWPPDRQPQLQPHHLSLAVWSLGRLQLLPRQGALEALLQQAQPLLGAMGPQELSMLLLGLAKMPGQGGAGGPTGSPPWGCWGARLAPGLPHQLLPAAPLPF